MLRVAPWSRRATVSLRLKKVEVDVQVGELGRSLIVRRGNASAGPDQQLCITTLDCLKGFWQVPVRHSDRQYLAFVTPIGKFPVQPRSLGLVTATSILNEFMGLKYEQYVKVDEV
eukprot:491105-Hanusia_phi.AAC.1